MTTYVWTIQSLSVLQTPEPDTVVVTGYTLTGEDAGTVADLSGVAVLLPADPSNFTPYDQITEAQAIAWTQAALGPVVVGGLENNVQQLIDELKVPQPQPAPLPWGA
jgi:hypothetical protein